jgi:hypothetical protein
VVAKLGGSQVFGLVSRPAREAGLAGGVWLVLALPVYLIWRRGLGQAVAG